MGERMNEGKNTGKGYVFGADILLAVIIFVLLFGAMQYSLTEPKASGVETLQMRQIMDDTLSLLDRGGTLQSFNETTIAAAVNGVLPLQYDYKMKIEKWTVSGSNWTLAQTKNLGNQVQDLSDQEFVKGRRLFVKFSGTGIDSYYNLEYWVWIK